MATDNNPFAREKKLVDPSERAARVLDKVLSEEELALAGEAEAPASPIAETGDERYIEGSERQYIRVAMISTDRELFVRESMAQQRAQSLGSIFEEVHIIVLSDRTDDLHAVRLAENVWAYPTNSRSPLWYPYDAYALAKRQLLFGDGFRVDAVSAENPFAAGLAAYALARRFKRALEIEVRLDPFAASFKDALPHNKWLSMLAGFLIPRATTVRTLSETLKDMVERRYKKLKGKVDALPVFSDLSAYPDTQPAFDLHLEYPLLKFIILMAAPLTKESGIGEGIDACAPLLAQYPTVGLVIVGDGLARAALEKKVSLLNLQNQIVFRGPHADLLSHAKTADVFLNTAAVERYDDTIARIAASGLPIISTDVGFARDLLEDGKSGFLCPVGDTACFSARLAEFLSNNQLRTVFSSTAQDRMLKIIAQNIGGYFEALRSSLERCVVAYGGASADSDAPAAA